MTKIKMNKNKSKMNLEVLGIETDFHKIIGSGTFKFKGEKIKFVRIGIEYLEKALNILKILNKEDITLGIREDCPLFLGNWDKVEKTHTGILIASKTKEDD